MAHALTSLLYQLINSFCNKGIEEVKQCLTQYCLERKVEGYIMQQDPLQAFYQTLCVGMDGEWDDILSYPDEFIPEDFDATDDFISPNSERVEEMDQPAAVATMNTIGKGPRLPRYSLAEQVTIACYSSCHKLYVELLAL